MRLAAVTAGGRAEAMNALPNSACEWALRSSRRDTDEGGIQMPHLSFRDLIAESRAVRSGHAVLPWTPRSSRGVTVRGVLVPTPKNNAFPPVKPEGERNLVGTGDAHTEPPARDGVAAVMPVCRPESRYAPDACEGAGEKV